MKNIHCENSTAYFQNMGYSDASLGRFEPLQVGDYCPPWYASGQSLGGFHVTRSHVDAYRDGYNRYQQKGNDSRTGASGSQTGCATLLVLPLVLIILMIMAVVT